MEPQGPRVEITRTEITRGTLKVSVQQWCEHRAELCLKHKIPESAKVEVEIPGGGDWSNCRVDAKDIDIVVTWKAFRDVK